MNQTAQRLLRSLGHENRFGGLETIFPEIVGNESYISDIVITKKGDYRIEYVNRHDIEGRVRYLNLLVLPDETPNCALLVIEDATEKAQMQQQINQQRYELYLYQHVAEFRNKFLSDSILGNSKVIRDVRGIIEKLSRVSSATVLLTGDTGTGKNLAARVIHYSSMGPTAPFVEINCAALPEHLIESELFGYEKGAFTHAVNMRPGLLEEARDGTIFLDEIGEMPLNLQSKLLSVIETKRIRRLGSNTPIEVNIRVIAATNRDLQHEVYRKRFREDLYYRLNVVSFQMPSLREMGEDILTIANHLVRVFNIEFKKDVKGFTAEAQRALLDYPWPGNVRELGNCIERAMIFTETEKIHAVDLVILDPQALKHTRQWIVPPGGIVLEDVERQLILSALEQTGQNKAKAARLLGLTRDTLRYRMAKYDLA
jgi:transcriptional regulator with PAS, ATPase and Fis domain